MTPELTALALAGLLQIAQICLYSVTGIGQMGLGTALGPRDDRPVLTGRPGRVQRAMNNHFEGLILFTLAVVVVTGSGTGSELTAACAWTYLAARVLYVPAYVLGLAPWRSAIWTVGLAATGLMLVAALAGA